MFSICPWVPASRWSRLQASMVVRRDQGQRRVSAFSRCRKHKRARLRLERSTWNTPAPPPCSRRREHKANRECRRAARSAPPSGPGFASNVPRGTCALRRSPGGLKHKAKRLGAARTTPARERGFASNVPRGTRALRRSPGAQAQGTVMPARHEQPHFKRPRLRLERSTWNTRAQAFSQRFKRRRTVMRAASAGEASPRTFHVEHRAPPGEPACRRCPGRSRRDNATPPRVRERRATGRRAPMDPWTRSARGRASAAGSGCGCWPRRRGRRSEAGRARGPRCAGRRARSPPG